MGSLWSSFEQDDAPDPHPRFPLRLRRISRLWSRVSFPSEEGRLRCNSNRSWRMHLKGVCRLPGRMGCRRRRSARLGGSQDLQRMGLLPTETPVCERVKADHKECTAKAYEDYKTVFAEGEDGRPHWVARKTCNYLTEAIDVCGNRLLEGGCMTEEKLAKHKDEQIGKSLERVKSSVDYWDSSKCPPVRTYMQRIGLIPSDDETSSTSTAVGARFGGADRDDGGSGAGGEDESEVEDSIDQGPWGLAAYAYYWWSGATGQTDRFSRS